MPELHEHRNCTGFTYCGAKIFNSLPIKTRETQDRNIFKTLVKKWIWDEVPSYWKTWLHQKITKLSSIFILYSNLYFHYHLTPNRPVIHTCFTYPILNMDDFSILNASLGYGDSTWQVKWKSLLAQRGIGKGEGSGIIYIVYIKVTYFMEL